MIKQLVLVFLLIYATVAQNQEATKPVPAPEEGDAMVKETYIPTPKNWLTLNGTEPVVIARGGLSGIFPESSALANAMAVSTCLPNLIVLCNLQFSKDGVGICISDVNIQKSTNIEMVFPQAQSTKTVNGKDIKGWFAVDYNYEQLMSNLSLVQNKLSRPTSFDNSLQISAPELVSNIDKVPSLWLNVQDELFYSEHNISVENYITEYLPKEIKNLNYISSPEIGFLKTIGGKVDKKTKLVFKVLEPNAVEPTTNLTFSSILKNLTEIKSFASGIFIPKSYIIPVNNKAKYFEPATTLVIDAHKAGLEVYASGFANDNYSSYSYNFDPVSEYLKFIDNSQFAVDGFVTDFPPTATEAIVCFALTNATDPKKDRPLIITHNGASGIYAGCTDLAYQQAVDDGADIIDCTVQMSKDGVAFCLASADLTGKTNAATVFMSKAISVPEIQKVRGIFSFDLTWTEIQSLKPEIYSPYLEGRGPEFQRNPEAKNRGKFVTLDGFLEFAKAKAVSGILINIENAAYLASKKGLGVVDAVAKALSNATFDKQSTQQVMIESDDSSVLSKFSDVPAYNKVLYIKKEASEAPKDVVEEIKKYASAVVVPRTSVIATTESFTTNVTNIIKDLHSANISVYISPMRNEFISIAFDYMADPVIELATFIQGVGVDGIVTEFPATASKYLRSKCSDPEENETFQILPVKPGELFGLIVPSMRPNIVYYPALTVADIVRPALPPVTPVSPSTPGSDPAAQGGVTTNVASLGLTLAAIMVFCFLSMEP